MTEIARQNTKSGGSVREKISLPILAKDVKIWIKEDPELPKTKHVQFFGYVRKSVWIVVILVLLGLSVNDSVEIIKQYIEKPLSSELDFKIFKSISLGNATFCVPFNYRTDLPTLENDKAIVEEDLQRFIQAHPNRRSLLQAANSFYDIGDPVTRVMALLSDYFAKMTWIESIDPNHHVDLRDIRQGPRRFAQYEQILKLLGHFEQNGFTHVDIFHWLGDTLVRHLGLQIVTHIRNAGYAEAEINGGAMTRIDDSEACFHMPVPELTEIDNDVTFRFSLERLLAKYNESRFLMMDFRGGRFVQDAYADSVVGMNMGATTQLSFSLTITGKYYVLPSNYREKNRCSLKETNLDCVDRCRIELIRNLCGCTPISSNTLLKKHEGYPTCDFERYFNTCKLVYGGLSDRDCVDSCPKHCTRWTYSIITQHRGNNPYDRNRGAAEMVLYFPSFQYPVFKEVTTITWHNFVGNFGGIIGLWLGASVLGLADRALWLFRFFSRRIYKHHAVSDVAVSHGIEMK